MSIPPLRHAFLAHITADWEDFAELRRAASARGHRSRLSNAVSILVNEIRVSMAAALLSAPLLGSAAPDAAAASEATAKAALSLRMAERHSWRHGTSRPSNATHSLPA